MATLLELTGISKRFGETIAAQDLSLEIKPGEIHAILGENGAGKSTLMKMIFGVLAPDAGTFHWKGKEVTIPSPAAARSLGVGMVFQHFSLFETLSVAENISLSNGITLNDAKAQIAEIGKEFGLEVAPDALVHSLSMGERQRIEIIRALMGAPELIIMDEPTSVLPPTAIPGLFKVIRALADRGCAVLFISHKLAEIRALCDRATVMRRGQIVGTVIPAEVDEAVMTKLMLGHEIAPPTRQAAKLSDAPQLEVSGLCIHNDDPFGVSLKDIALKVHGGEIVGIAGVSGNGQKLLAAALSGEVQQARADAGRITLLGADATALDCLARRRLGLSYVPEDRQGSGAVMELSLTDNSMLTAHERGIVKRGLINRRVARDLSAQCITDMDVRCSGPEAEARSLSGGNLQKFIVGRELSLAPQFLIASQPTWGVDVGAARSILQKIVDLRSAGVGCLIISDELEDLLEVSDRLYVMFRGQLSPSISRAEARDEVIGAYMSGSFEVAA